MKRDFIGLTAALLTSTQVCTTAEPAQNSFADGIVSITTDDNHRAATANGFSGFQRRRDREPGRLIPPLAYYGSTRMEDPIVHMPVGEFC